MEIYYSLHALGLFFRESVEKKIEDPNGRITGLTKMTSGKAKELVKPFYHD